MELGLDDVTQFLHAALDKGCSGEESEQAALEVMASLADRARLSELLRSVHASSNVTAGCARKSYLHPLGFHKLMLVNASPLFELRIHVWRPTYTVGVDHIHNHRFGFVTSVIRGGYDMQIFQTSSNGTPMLEYREVADPHSGWKLEQWGSAQLQLLTSVRLRQGASYALAAETLHQVTVPEGTHCVTLLLRTTATSSTTRVFVRRDQKVQTLIPIVFMSPEEYRHQLELVLDELTG
jgi:hypothetical protein